MSFPVYGGWQPRGAPMVHPPPQLHPHPHHPQQHQPQHQQQQQQVFPFAPPPPAASAAPYFNAPPSQPHRRRSVPPAQQTQSTNPTNPTNTVAFPLPPRARVRCVRWSPQLLNNNNNSQRNAQLLACGLSDGTVVVYAGNDLDRPVFSPPSSSKIRSCEARGHTKTVSDIAWDETSEPRRFATVSHDRTLRVWEVTCADRSGKEKEKDKEKDKDLRLSVREVVSVSLSSDGEAVAWPCGANSRYIVAGTRDDHVHVFDTAITSNSTDSVDATSTSEFARLAAKVRMKEEVISLVAAPDGIHVLAALGNGQLLFLRSSDASIVVSLRASNNRLLAVAIDSGVVGDVPAASAAASCGGDGQEGTTRVPAAGRRVPRRFAVGGHDSVATVWDAANVTCESVFAGMTWPVQALSMSSDAELCAAGGEDSYVAVFRCLDGVPVSTIPFEGRCSDVCFHPELPDVLAIATEDSGEGRLFMVRC